MSDEMKVMTREELLDKVWRRLPSSVQEYYNDGGRERALARHLSPLFDRIADFEALAERAKAWLAGEELSTVELIRALAEEAPR